MSKTEKVSNIIQYYIPRIHSGTESQLYIVRNVSDGSSTPVLFDPDLNNFMVNTFVMELEYMFVQVG